MSHAASTRSTVDEARQQHCAVLVSRHLRRLFDRLPALAGFQLRSDLMVGEVWVVNCASRTSTSRLHVSVMQALVEMAECDPEAIELMRGGTFARHMH